MLLVRLLINCRLLVVMLWRSQKLHMDFRLHERASAPNPYIIQGSTLLAIYSMLPLMTWSFLWASSSKSLWPEYEVQI